MLKQQETKNIWVQTLPTDIIQQLRQHGDNYTHPELTVEFQGNIAHVSLVSHPTHGGYKTLIYIQPQEAHAINVDLATRSLTEITCRIQQHLGRIGVIIADPP